MSRAPRIDLHTHSSVSDGTEPPEKVVSAAAETGLDIVALTDHDTADGWPAAVEAGERVGIQVVPGIEVSTTWHGDGVHLLAYLVDAEDARFAAELVRVRSDRRRRIDAIVDRLAGRGVVLDVDEILAAASAAAAIGRPHIADAMVARGYVRDRDEAFRDWLGAGQVGYVPKYAPNTADAVRMVRAAGGVTVLAHPWGRGSRWTLDEGSLVSLADAGLDGIEVDHEDHSARARTELRAIAARIGLAVTGSSDYHGTGKTGHHLGVNTTAPDQWERLAATAQERRIQR